MTIVNPLHIGGSSAAAALGLSPWESRLALWERLSGAPTGRTWAEEEAARLEAGRAMEPLIAKRATALYGVRFSALGDDIAPLRHKREPRIVGHLDAVTADNEPAEFKLTGSPVGKGGWGEPGTDQVPPQYLAQVCHYLALHADAKRAHLFALRVPSYRLDHYVVQRDDALCDVLIQRELELLEMVDTARAPDPQNEDEARRLWFQADPRLQQVADAEVLAALTKRYVASKAAGVLERVISDCNFTILRGMRDAGILVDAEAGEPIASATTNRVFDEARFAAEFPEIAAACTRLDTSRLRREHKRAYEACMREPRTPDESTRTIRLRKEFAEACRRLVAGGTVSLPYVPELGKLTMENDDGE